MNQTPESRSDQGHRSSDPAKLDETIEFWTPIARRDLTHEDARQIRENLTGFFRVLRRWDAAEAASNKPDIAAPVEPVEPVERKRAA
jgi:hypothetical protein